MRVPALVRLTTAGLVSLLLASVLLPALANAAVWTDQADYSPGSVVTISGDNSDGAGFLTGETVDVAVNGPNGYSSWCSGVADDAGAWSCQVTLWSTDLAGGAYAYAATGETSGASQSGTFTDAVNFTLDAASFTWYNAGATSAGFDVTVSGTYQCNSGNPAAQNCSAASVALGIFPSDGANNGVTGSSVASATLSLGATTSSTSPWSHVFHFPADFPVPADGQYDVKASFTFTPGSGGTTASVKYNDNAFGVDSSSPTSSIDTVGAGTIPTASGMATDPGSGTPVPHFAGFNNSDSPKPVRVEIHTNPGNALVAGSAQSLTLTSLGGNKQTGSWAYTYAGSALAPGGYCILSTAIDHAGNIQSTSTSSCFSVSSSIGTTTVASSESATYGDTSVTLNASVTPASGPPVSSGTVTFTVNGTSVTSGTVSAGTASATLSLTGFIVGQYGIAVAYNPGSGFTGSDNSGQTPSPELMIGKASSTTTVSCPAGTYIYTGSAQQPCTYIVSGADGLDIGPNPVPTSGYTGNVAAGTATASYAYPGDANHTASTLSSDTFVIAKADPTCTVTPYTSATVTYDANPHTATPADCAGVLGEDVSGTFDVTGTTHTDAGDYPTDAWSFTSNDSNYNDASGTVDDSIAKADPTCTVTPYNLVVDGFSHTATSGGCTGVVGEVVSGSFDLTGTTHTLVGQYTADAWSFASADSNYNDASGTITDWIHYQFAGTCLGSPGHSILQPINADGTSVFKQGSTVPAKFRVCDASGASVGTSNVVKSFRLTQVVSGTIISSVDEAVDSTTPDSMFRWDPTGQQWIFNLNTKPLAKNATYHYLITLNDNSTISFQFGLK